MSKFKGFKAVVFIFVSLLVGFYVWACSENDTLISLQGLMLAWIGLAGVIIGAREVTKQKELLKK